MIKREIHLSKKFKIQATKAILSISFFIFTYLIILVLAMILTGLCIAGGITLISLKPMFATIALGIGLASLGVLVLVFLIKFIFKSHKVDRSHLIEITKESEPELFQMIKEIVIQVRTHFPKKIYLSSDVNASVFYDSSFWSMFLPVKKNLILGLGLVNTVTRLELKAILSHEFGHFSQRSMKVGSYVYNVNQIIFNMLYENESYENIIQKWASASGYFSIFVVVAVKINESIQYILRKLYIIVNKNYLSLSREMEFHADEIAASITGTLPLKKSLLRMSLADNSYNEVINFYNNKISKNLKSGNLYSDQAAVMNFLSEVNSLPLTNDLPDISLEEQSKYNKSKLVIKDQWSSHPTIEERINRLERIALPVEYNSDYQANRIFSNIYNSQNKITNKLFDSIRYEGEIQVIETEQFLEEYKKETIFNSFSKIYNGYYDNKNPAKFDLKITKPVDESITFNKLFSLENVDLVHTSIALQNDIQTLTNILNNNLSVKSFDYDGIRFKQKEATGLIERLKPEMERVNELIKSNDYAIYQFFTKEESHQNKNKALEQLYIEFFEFDEISDSKYELYTKLLKELQFTSVTTPYDQIKSNFKKLLPLEESLKDEIKQILADKVYLNEISTDIEENLKLYTSKSLEYFGVTVYNEESLNVLYSALNNYAYLISKKYFLLKKKILTYQEELTKPKNN